VADLYDPDGHSRNTDDRSDAICGGPFERINNNQQLHKGVVDRLATRLHDEHVAATNVFLNLDANFSVTE